MGLCVSKAALDHSKTRAISSLTKEGGCAALKTATATTRKDSSYSQVTETSDDDIKATARTTATATATDEEVTRVRSGEQTSTSVNDRSSVREERGDRNDSDFEIAKVLFEEELKEREKKKSQVETDRLIAKSMQEDGSGGGSVRAGDSTYEEVLERWKKRVGEDELLSWSRKLDDVVREAVFETPYKVKRQLSVPITPKRNDDEDLRIALALSKEDADKVERDHDVLIARLDAFGLREKKVSGDGNCQFRALSDQLFRTPEHYGEVRKKIVQQLRKHASRYAAYVVRDDDVSSSSSELDVSDDKNIPSANKKESKSAFFMMQTAYSNYCDDMAVGGAWGDHVTLQAAADVYGAQITVVTSYLDNGVLEITPNVSDSNGDIAPRNLWLSFWAEVHYNSVYPKMDFKHSPPDKNKDKEDVRNDNSNSSGGGNRQKDTNNKNRKDSDDGGKDGNDDNSINSADIQLALKQAKSENDAAFRIQMSFRGAQARKKTVSKPQLLERSQSILKIHEAASVIQRAFRVYRIDRIEKERYESIMTRIKNNTPEKAFYSSPLRNLGNLGGIRMELFKSSPPRTPEDRKREFFENQRAFEKKAAAIKIQAAFRGLMERKNMLGGKSESEMKKLLAFLKMQQAKIEYEGLRARQNSSAILIQSLARGSLARKQFHDIKAAKQVELKAKQNNAALLIQSLARGALARKQFNEIKAAAAKQEELNARQREAALLIQSLVRGALARKQFNEIKAAAARQEELNARQLEAALLIQSLVRGALARKQFNKIKATAKQEELKAKQLEAAIKFQAMFRGVIARKRMTEANEAAVKIQAMVKMQKAKREYQNLQEKRRCSALKLQSFARGVLARKKFNETKSAAIKIQSVIKMAQERKRFFLTRQAVIIIQTRVRASIEGRRERERFEQKCNAVKKMQSLFRMAIEKRRFAETRNAVVKIQSIARMKIAKQQLEFLKNRNESAKRLQAVYRGQLVRKRQNELRKHAVSIQSAFRGYATRKKYNLASYYVGWDIANSATWLGNSSSDEEDTDWTTEYYLRSPQSAIKEHYENMVKNGIIAPATSEPFSPRTIFEIDLESHPAISPNNQNNKNKSKKKKKKKGRHSFPAWGFAKSDYSEESDQEYNEHHQAEPNSVLIKSISQTSGATVLVRKQINTDALEESLAMKRKIQMDFEQLEREKMQKEKSAEEKRERERNRSSSAGFYVQTKRKLKSVLIDKPVACVKKVSEFVTSKQMVELVLKCTISFFAFDAYKTVSSNVANKKRTHAFGRTQKPLLIIEPKTNKGGRAAGAIIRANLKE